jgi:hypothetical protein
VGPQCEQRDSWYAPAGCWHSPPRPTSRPLRCADRPSSSTAPWRADRGTASLVPGVVALLQPVDRSSNLLGRPVNHLYTVDHPARHASLPPESNIWQSRSSLEELYAPAECTDRPKLTRWGLDLAADAMEPRQDAATHAAWREASEGDSTELGRTPVEASSTRYPPRFMSGWSGCSGFAVAPLGSRTSPATPSAGRGVAGMNGRHWPTPDYRTSQVLHTIKPNIPDRVIHGLVQG